MNQDTLNPLQAGGRKCTSLSSEGPHGNGQIARTKTKHLQPQVNGKQSHLIQAGAGKSTVRGESADCRDGGGRWVGSYCGGGEGEAGDGISQGGLC